MWKIPASVLCLAALPLFGCAGDFTARQAAVTAPPPVSDNAAYYAASPRVYAIGPAAPAAVLVFLPGDYDFARDPAPWAAQGFDVVMPQPAEFYRMVADQRAALARLVASAQMLADAPIWLVCPSHAIETAIPQLGGEVAGAVVTSSPIASCSESFSYYDPGTGAPPQVHVKKSGDCGAGLPGITGRQPSTLLPAPGARPNKPRIIEASAVGKYSPATKQVRHLAELIKSTPSG